MGTFTRLTAVHQRSWLLAASILSFSGWMCAVANEADVAQPAATDSADSSSASTTQLEEVIVTAQKRSEQIDKVGMSITAASGAQLSRQGITSVEQLTKIVPGFVFNQTAYATPVYTIRGVGFQESSLAASPSVSVYLDEIPFSFPIETSGANLDVERVEVLKGPQGTLFGENSTGGAVNYVAAKPPKEFEAGGEATYGRFGAADVQGFVGGPLSDRLLVRAALRTVQGGAWQHSYTRDDTLGDQNFTQGRLLLNWLPSDRLNVMLGFNGVIDRSDTPAPQVIGISPLGLAPLPPGLANYPLAPHNDRAADWTPGISYGRNNRFGDATARIVYEFAPGLELTSLTAYQRYTRNQNVDEDGTIYYDNATHDSGSISSVFQELRLAGPLWDRGHWLVGANYGSDAVTDSVLGDNTDSSERLVFGLPLTTFNAETTQHIHTYAIYANADHQITDTLKLLGGIRFTQSDRKLNACNHGPANLSAVTEALQSALTGGPVAPIPPGTCIALDSNFQTGPVLRTLNQNNVSWKGGLDWQPDNRTLLYANVSKGFKAGSFPTVASFSASAFDPVTQESILAYEGGFKQSMFDHALQVNGAVYYYDYTNKQIRGRVEDPIFGALEALVNIPKSHIAGAELDIHWLPVEGLKLAPSVSYVYSKIDGAFTNFTPFGVSENFSGESFPYTPKWTADLDAEYDWNLNDRLVTFVGANVNYQSATNGAFGQLPILDINQRTLLDLRFGIESKSGAWRVMAWGRNVTNAYYWTSADRFVDTVFRYAGMPATFGVTVGFNWR